MYASDMCLKKCRCQKKQKVSQVITFNISCATCATYFQIYCSIFWSQLLKTIFFSLIFNSTHLSFNPVPSPEVLLKEYVILEEVNRRCKSVEFYCKMQHVTIRFGQFGVISVYKFCCNFPLCSWTVSATWNAIDGSSFPSTTTVNIIYIPERHYPPSGESVLK